MPSLLFLLSGARRASPIPLCCALHPASQHLPTAKLPLSSPKGMEWVVAPVRMSRARWTGALVFTSTTILSPTTMRGLFSGNWPTREMEGRPGSAREGGEKNSAVVSAVTCGRRADGWVGG